MYKSGKLITNHFLNRIIDRFHCHNDIRLVGTNKLDPAVHRPDLRRQLRLGQGREGPVVVRGQVLDEDEAGDAGSHFLRGGGGELLPVLHDGDLQLLVGDLDDHRGRLLVSNG